MSIYSGAGNYDAAVARERDLSLEVIPTITQLELDDHFFFLYVLLVAPAEIRSVKNL